MPYGMIANLSGNDAYANWPASFRGQGRGYFLLFLPGAHYSCAKVSVTRQELAIVLLVIGKKERLLHSDGPCAFPESALVEPFVKTIERLGEACSASRGIVRSFVYRSELGHRHRPS